MRISDWSSDVCSSDLKADRGAAPGDRSDERLARDIAVAQAAELLQRLIEDEARGDDAHRGIRLDDRGVGVEPRRERLEPHPLGVAVRTRPDGVMAVDKGADTRSNADEPAHPLGDGP